ncbi:MAG: flavodoxin domain-containing protein [Pseudomonadales bacterium]
MKKLVMVYHSQSGSTERLASAIAEGVSTEGGVKLVVLRACDACSRDLEDCDLLLVGCAENSGHMSGGIKGFLDRVFYPLLKAERLMPYGLFVSAGNDGRNAVREIDRIAGGLGFKSAVEPLIVRGEVTQADIETARELGAAVAAGTQMGIF